jgi:hypothetical protein
LVILRGIDFHNAVNGWLVIRPAVLMRHRAHNLLIETVAVVAVASAAQEDLMR